MENINGKPKPLALSLETLQSELARLEGEFKKGQALVQNTNADLLRIEGAILALRNLLKDSSPAPSSPRAKG